MVFRLLGLINGIVATQIAAAVSLASMAGVRDERLAVAFYLTFSAAQWMSSPGLVQPADDRDAGQGAQHGRCDDAAL